MFNRVKKFGTGSTGDPPVPSGHWPDGTGSARVWKTSARKNANASTFPSGESPLGTGQWPVPPKYFPAN
jgi:hypothetical protein